MKLIKHLSSKMFAWNWSENIWNQTSNWEILSFAPAKEIFQQMIPLLTEIILDIVLKYVRLNSCRQVFY